MKRFWGWGLCVLWLFCTVSARAEAPAVITEEDIAQVRNTGAQTVEAYLALLPPDLITWYSEGTGSGATFFTLEAPDGSVTLRVEGAAEYRDDERGQEGVSALEGEVLGLPAQLTGMVWNHPDLTAIRLPRGLALGDSRQNLESVFGGLMFSDVLSDSADAGYDRVASCLLSVPEDAGAANAYYGLDFFLKDDVIVQAQMWYEPGVTL